MRVFFNIRGLSWLLQLRLWLRRREPIGQILESGIDEDGRWSVKVRITNDRAWQILTGKYRPWRLRIVNLFRWLARKPPKPAPRVNGFSICGSAEREDV